MPIARIGNTILFFAHIPKTGGSSIEAYLAARGQVCLLSKHATGFSRVTPQHMERETYDRYIPRQFYDHGFAILRDPIKRLQSEFRHQMRLARKPGRVLSALIPTVVKAGRGPCARAAEKYVHQGDFDGWVNVVLPACKSDAYIFDGHIRPQADYVHGEHKLFDLADGLDRVIAWIDQAAGIESQNSPVPHEKRSPGSVVGMSAATEKRARQFYAKDYELLKYLPRHPVSGQTDKGGQPARGTTHLAMP